MRLGGIYALARIARDSPADRATISEVLIAFVRGHASWPPRFPDQPADTEPIDQVLALQVRAADIQAIMTVLGTGGFGAGPVTPGARLELHAVDLRRAQLIGVHLGGVQLDGAHLEKAKLDGAYLGRANLSGAHLQGGVLLAVGLHHANLDGAHLEGADLRIVDFKGARLTGANFDGANLDSAVFEGAVDDEHTVWPAGFEREVAGVIREEIRHDLPS